MGLLDKIKGELVDIIEWIDDSRTTLAWRFPRYNNEIKNGAELIVREGQKAVFVYRGQLADKFEPGHYKLTTEALPILATLQGWKHGFQSPFRSEVYFINTRPVTDLRWGTPQPITIRDPDFSMIPIRANGLCVVRIADVEIFLREIIGTDSAVELDELTELLRRLIATAFADLLTGSGYGALELQGKNAEIADKLRDLVQERVDDEYGLKIDSIAMNVSLPEEVTAALTAGVARGVETRGYVQNVGDVGRLQQVRAADATLAAAENPGGAAGAMVGAGIGLGLGGQLGQTIAANQAAGATPPPLLAAMYHVEVNGAATGPYNLAQLQQAMQAGQLQGSTLVWTNGMAGWAAASSVAQLAPLFATPPPPPPPPAPPAPSAPPAS
ncbi:MAG TPA: SPFH domain-containing protein [Sporichthya sp.]|nr:SPFH domain-containing protein [Sporichthya sp.]